MPTPPTESLRVLQFLRSKTSFGFEVMSKLDMKEAAEFVDALNPLLEERLIRITGETHTDGKLRDAVFAIPLNKIGEVDFLLRRNPPQLKAPRF